MLLLAELQPFDPVLGVRRMIRVCSFGSKAELGLNGQRWLPAMTGTLPQFGIKFFEGDFTGSVAPTAGAMTINLRNIVRPHNEPNARRYNWSAAPIRFYAGVAGQAWPWTIVAEMMVSGFTAEDETVSLQLRTDDETFLADVLPLKYAGTGGIEGPLDLKNSPKPLLLGRCFRAAPILLDAVYNVYQVSGYGPIEGVTALYEKGAKFAASFGDYADWAALIAATIPDGRWATCNALGLIRLGAPAAGIITLDVDGDKAGGTWRRKPGEICLRLLENAAPTARIATASFTALDASMAALPNQGRMGIYLTDQSSVLDVVARITAACNWISGVSLLGQAFTRPVAPGTPTITLDAQRKQLPRVAKCTEQSVSPPYSFIEFGYARCWRVHAETEIAVVAGDGLPRIEAPASRTFTANYAGTIDAAQLPTTFVFKRFRGDADVSTTTTWVLDGQPGITGATLTIANGVVPLPVGIEIGANSRLRVKSSRDGLDLFAEVAITRSDGPLPISGGSGGGGGGSGGGTSANDSTFNNVTGTAMVDISDELTVKTGTGGTITLSGILAINAAVSGPPGTFGAKLRWQIKPVGGSYSAVGGSDIMQTETTVIEYDAESGGYSLLQSGSINASSIASGLTASTDYIVKLTAARDSASPAKVIGFGGTVYAVGS